MVVDGASHVDFAVPMPLAPAVRGRFREVAGLLQPDGPDASITLVVGTGSLTTGSPRRRRLLAGPDLPDVGNHPLPIVMFDRVRPEADGWAAQGTLQVKGRRAPVEARFTLDEGLQRFTAVVSADRGPLGLVWAQPPGGEFTPLGRRVDLTLTLDVEAVQR